MMFRFVRDFKGFLQNPINIEMNCNDRKFSFGFEPQATALA
jgi:hypothetical protein